MKIKDLIEREPFGAILERTLCGFLDRQTGRRHHVRWYPDGVRRGGGGEEQIWLCRPELNALFTRDTHPECMSYLRWQYAHSPITWKRVPQSCAVALMTHPMSAYLHCGPCLGIAPSLPDRDRWIIMGGTNRLRIVDFFRGTVLTILKFGFNPIPCGQIFVWMGVIELPICQMRLRAQLVAWRGRLFAFSRCDHRDRRSVDMLIMHLAAASGFHGALRPWVEADAEKREHLYAPEYVFGRKS